MLDSRLTSPPRWTQRWARGFGLAIVCALLALFLPWQQFSSGEGRIIGLDPNDRFQEVHAPVSGVVRRWHVTEGRWVKQGDPLVSLSDTDVDLVGRLDYERVAAESALASAELGLKTARINEERQRRLFDEGLSARKQWEKERINIAKLSMEVSKAKAVLAKAQREFARQNSQIVRAPRDAWVVRVRSGEGAQMVKQGDPLLILAPKTERLAAEIWVDANDATLIQAENKARLEIAGWPAVQIPGWPSVAIGTFGAKVVLVDAIASQKGRFRVLLEPTERWPSELFVRQGARVSGFVNMSTVSVGRELWRQFNGLPARNHLVEDELSKFLEAKSYKTDNKGEEK